MLMLCRACPGALTSSQIHCAAQGIIMDSDSDQDAAAGGLQPTEHGNGHPDGGCNTIERRDMQHEHRRRPANDNASSVDPLPATQPFADSEQQSGGISSKHQLTLYHGNPSCRRHSLSGQLKLAGLNDCLKNLHISLNDDLLSNCAGCSGPVHCVLK